MRLIMAAGAAFLVLAMQGAAADTFAVTKLSETATTITLGWAPQAGYGYLFSADGRVVSRTYNPATSSARFSKGASSYEVAVIAKGATGSYPEATPPPEPPNPPEPPPPPPSGNDLVMTGRWTCSKAVNYDLVRVTNNGGGDTVTLGSGCTGRIGRLEVSGSVNGDGLKIQNQANPAHDLTIDGGYISCAHASTDGTHQDGVQGMGGSNILFRNVAIDCYGGGGGNFFINRAGSGASTPTGIVCDHCALGPRHPNNVQVNNARSSGVRDSLVCRPTSGRTPFREGGDLGGNTIVSSGDARCATLAALREWAGS